MLIAIPDILAALFIHALTMIDHVSFSVADFSRSKAFYAAALAPLGYKLLSEFTEWSVAGFGAGGKSDMWIKQGDAAQPSHLAFNAATKDEVDKFYAAGLNAGGKDNGAPGYRKDYSPGYYAAFLTDPDGHNIEAVFHDPNPIS